MSKLNYLLSLTPLETWRILRHRLPVLRGGPAWTANELMSSAKYGRGIRFAELLMRQEAIARRHCEWAPLNFVGKRVVEVGCGPLGGYGPLAIFCGATVFESAEPEWDESIISNKLVIDRYLSVFHADLVGLYGPRMDFPAFLNALKTRMTVHRCGFESAPISGPVDIVLSQSCLEHVFPFDGTVAKLAELQTPATRFLHLVDFGNHYPTDNAFEGLYEQPPDVYIARRGKAINLLREPDIIAGFERKGIAVRAIPARLAGDTYTGTVHSWWRERYGNAALFTQLSLVVGPPA